MEHLDTDIVADIWVKEKKTTPLHPEAYMPTAMSTGSELLLPCHRQLASLENCSRDLSLALEVCCSMSVWVGIYNAPARAQEQNCHVISFSISFYSWVWNETQSIRQGWNILGRKKIAGSRQWANEWEICCEKAEIQVQMCGLRATWDQMKWKMCVCK